MTPKWTHQVVAALGRAMRNFTAEELAYTVLTSKSELPLRDRLAWQLQLATPSPPYFISREWNKVDLAVVKNGDPVVLLEAKALYSFDAVRPTSLLRYSSLIHKDIGKALNLALPDTQVMVAVFMTHVGDHVSDRLDRIVKYRPSINKALAEHTHPDDLHIEAVAAIDGLLDTMGSATRVEPPSIGSALGLGVTVDGWIAEVPTH